jgi:hypothetical protein
MLLSKYRTRNRTNLHRLSLSALMTSAFFFAAAPPSHAAPGRTVAGNTPRFVSDSKVLSREVPTKVIEVSLWLEPRNRAEMDSLAHSLYDSSPRISPQNSLPPAAISKPCNPFSNPKT